MKSISEQVDDTAITKAYIKVKAKAKALKQAFGIDYLQFIDGLGTSASREHEILKITRQLKSLPKNLNITVISLAQLSREPEIRSDSESMLSDIRSQKLHELSFSNTLLIALLLLHNTLKEIFFYKIVNTNILN